MGRAAYTSIAYVKAIVVDERPSVSSPAMFADAKFTRRCPFPHCSPLRSRPSMPSPAMFSPQNFSGFNWAKIFFLFLGCIAVLRPIFTDRVAWFVGRLVFISGCQSDALVIPAKTTEPIDIPFGLWTRVVPRTHASHGHTHWRHLANTIEPSMRRRYGLLCQITLTVFIFMILPLYGE